MPLVTSIISGLLWGILGSLATLSVFGPRSWFAAPLGALIGSLVYFLSRRFYTRSLLALIPVSILSTFVAVALFGLCLGAVDLFRGTGNRIPWAVIVQGMNACLWGLLYIPIYWLLFPLSFGNHALIRHLTLQTQARSEQEAAVGLRGAEEVARNGTH